MIVGILTFMSKINVVLSSVEHGKFYNLRARTFTAPTFKEYKYQTFLRVNPLESYAQVSIISCSHPNKV